MALPLLTLLCAAGAGAQAPGAPAAGTFPAEVTTTLEYHNRQTVEQGTPNVPLCQTTEWRASLRLTFRRSPPRGFGVEYEAVGGDWDASGSCRGEMTWQDENPPRECTWTTTGTSNGSGRFTPGGASKASLTLYPDGTYQIAFHLDEVNGSRTWSNPCRTSGSTTHHAPVNGSAEEVRYTLRGTRLELAPQGERETFVQVSGLRGHHRWTVGGAATRAMRVAIEGPDCGCIEPEKGPLPMRYTASASVPGGTFSEIEVVPTGAPPQEVANVSGPRATLDLMVTPATHGMTLRVKYTLDGKEQTAERTVNLCAMDSITFPTSPDDFFIFDDAPEGRMEVTAVTQATLGGQPASQYLQWSFQQMGEGTREEPGVVSGTRATHAYVGLPMRNSSFGEKQVEAVVRRDGCQCKRTRTYRTFFLGGARNHPHTARSDLPNYIIYWHQTAAGNGVPLSKIEYVASLGVDDNGNAIGAEVDDTRGIMKISEGVRTSHCSSRVDFQTRAQTGERSPRGIDCFGESVRHEWAHIVEYKEWWPLGWRIWADSDRDAVPNAMEESLPGCDPKNESSCALRPFSYVTDREIQAYWIGWSWPIGSVDKQDWSTCGRQLRLPSCQF